ncbi:MAG: hypothetical protein ABJA94_10140 [Rhodoglobus sp.]
MKRILPLALVVSVGLVLAGCSTTSSPTGTSPSSSAGSGSGSGSGSSSTVTSSYYPVAKGNTWVYTIDYGNGTIITDTEIMSKVVTDGTDATVTIDRTFHYDDGSQKDLVSSVDYLFHADGSLEVPFQSVPSASGVVTVKSGTMVWPTTAEFEAGTAKTGTIVASVDSGGTTTNEQVDFNIAGAGTEDVTVKAGSYPAARKLAQMLTISLPDLGVSGIVVNVTTWLAKGVGPVKTEVPDSNGGASILQQLVSFTAGK